VYGGMLAWVAAATAATDVCGAGAPLTRNVSYKASLCNIAKR
jgi:hypothetical protein